MFIPCLFGRSCLFPMVKFKRPKITVSSLLANCFLLSHWRPFPSREWPWYWLPGLLLLQSQFGLVWRLQKDDYPMFYSFPRLYFGFTFLLLALYVNVWQNEEFREGPLHLANMAAFVSLVGTSENCYYPNLFFSLFIFLALLFYILTFILNERQD